MALSRREISRWSSEASRLSTTPGQKPLNIDNVVAPRRSVSAVRSRSAL
nr:hypothetical protein [Patulibacter minatonensis]